MRKSGFTLFEVLISLIILSVSIGIVLKLSFFDDQVILYTDLVNMENQLIKDGKVTNSSKIVFK